MRQKNSELSVLAAIGGASEEFSKAFSKLSSSIETRNHFVENILSFIKRHSVQGIDIDWEFPSTEDDRKNFVLLLEQLSESFKSFGYILSVAVAPDKWRAQEFYDIARVTNASDFINLMSYDFYGPWNTKVGHHAQMFPHVHDSDYMRELNCAASVTFWLSKGASRGKLVLGIPTYGKAFVLSDKTKNKIGSEVDVNATKSSEVNVGYNEFCSSRASWKQHFDTTYRSYYATNKLQWLGFDSARQVAMKARYAQNERLGGVMFWSLDTDDYSGICKTGKFPLITASHLWLKVNQTF